MEKPPTDANEPLSRTSGREMATTLRDVLKDQEVRAERRSAPVVRTSRRSSPFEWLVLMLLAVPAGYFWLGSPGWLGPPPPEPVRAELLEAGLRMEVAAQAWKVSSFKQQEGRLPNSLQEAGEPFSEVRYVRVGPSEFHLWMQVGEIRAEYSSDEPLNPFLNPARGAILGGM